MMKAFSFRIFLIILIAFTNCRSFAQVKTGRELISIDKNWHFALGHLYDTEKDFDHATAYFSYLSKTGNGDGAAAPLFDDRAWRLLDLPHDWAVEQPFNEKGSFSHGFKEAGKGFPGKSIGWYRKKINIPQTDLGRIISIKFDGVFRNSKVWFNGHYLGTEESGYNGFEYDVTAYINYGSENTIAVRVDASMEEGWFYEGAGIYRHVYLQKTNPLHIISNGTYVTSHIGEEDTVITTLVSVENKGEYNGDIEILQTIFDPSGKQVASITRKSSAPLFYKTIDLTSTCKITNPLLWDIESPNLYRLVTKIEQEGKIVDSLETIFGIRSLRFDATDGFFLNGKHIKLQGTNDHQDHAGVGTAMPDELQYFRVQKLKEMGANAYRCSHNPPAPELLEACDRLGMLVIDETRLMGINDIHLNNLRRMIVRDRNHPSIFCWSVGNEEWNIEGNITGERITDIMQRFVKSLDSTRPVTVGISSGFKNGISSVVEIMGYNYMGNGDIDAHHNNFKQQPGMGTEEGSTFTTRGIYFTDDVKHYQSAYDRKPRPAFYSIEEANKFYATRPYLAGMFIWTGFDYRGEPTPYGWPSVSSYFGMMDICGFPKDNVYYLRSWWGKEPVLHILPHWNWPGMEGKEINVWVYSNCDEVELFLNNTSLGKKKMEQYGHLEWKVAYHPGRLEAVGYKKGKMIITTIQKTTSDAVAIKLIPHKQIIKKGNDIAIIAVDENDKDGLHIPTSNDEITFTVKAGGKIIGVGNGNPTSLEKDRFIDNIKLLSITGLQEQPLTPTESMEQLASYQEDKWKDAFVGRDYKALAVAYVYRGQFNLDSISNNDSIHFFYQKIGIDATVFVNGNKLTASVEDPQKYILAANLLKQGINIIHIIARPINKVHDWDVINNNPGIIRLIRPSGPWKRKLFNGYAQVIVQADGSSKEIILSASAKGIKDAIINIAVQ